MSAAIVTAGMIMALEGLVVLWLAFLRLEAGKPSDALGPATIAAAFLVLAAKLLGVI